MLADGGEHELVAGPMTARDLVRHAAHRVDHARCSRPPCCRGRARRGPCSRPCRPASARSPARRQSRPARRAPCRCLWQDHRSGPTASGAWSPRRPSRRSGPGALWRDFGGCGHLHGRLRLKGPDDVRIGGAAVNGGASGDFAGASVAIGGRGVRGVRGVRGRHTGPTDKGDHRTCSALAPRFPLPLACRCRRTDVSSGAMHFEPIAGGRASFAPSPALLGTPPSERGMSRSGRRPRCCSVS